MARGVKSTRGKRREKRRRPRLREPKYAFGFLDETGTLASPRDPFFAVGLLRCRDPYELQRPMQRIRDRKHFYDEIKWGKVSAKKIDILRILTDVFFSAEASLNVFVTDKRKHDVITRFNGQFGAYEALARQLVHGSIRRRETMFLIADEYSTPPGETFEENVRDYVNQKIRRRAIAGVCRMRSTGVDLLQLIDLLLGAIVYEYKAKSGIVGLADYKPKTQLLTHIKAKAGVDTFVGGYRDDAINVADYQG